MIDQTGHINWEMAVRLLDGEADEIDRGLLEQWLAHSEANRQEWKRICAAWNRGAEALMLETIDTDRAWDFLQNETLAVTPIKTKTRPWLPRVMAIAAILIIALGLFWMLWQPTVQPSSSLMVTNTEREEVVLSDGSSVTLNAGSKFYCEQPFKGDERQVELKGEGYFKVEGNRDWPFVVTTGGVTVRVLGTGFNVRAYPHLEMVEVAVVEGQVEVRSSDGSDRRVFLKAGQMALFQRQSGTLTVQDVDDPNLLGWITRRLQFQEASLGKVAETLGRIYRVDIHLGDPTLQTEKLTAQFSDNSLDFVLNVVCMTFNLKMEREGDMILLTRK